ncbi:hypothetical protein AGOR_G00096020 [Albula goreensis]|uniref:ubiquitinyl hydrolase 1 n=1 Tax=Albula goreensis TaxID=1534307 RepID=A0A8T3DGE6_9TELE|nr:hypothetical protein AGOR_G00096020 [Albula goreensis]
MSQGQSFLPKFLFLSNLLKAVRIRERVPNDVVKPSASGGVIHHLRGLHRHTLEMIRISHFPQAFREVIQAAIVDRAMQVSLEQEKKLNWCREVKRLVPLRTNGDGNCLLHAASQYMLGVQDTDLVLRKALYSVLKDTDTRNFRMRFQTELLQSQEFTQTGLCYNTLNWQEEWEKIVEMASPESSHGGLQYDSLEDIHIFVLSNILRRPIVVVADQVVRSMKSGSSFSPLNVGGVYLPLHWPPGDCYKYPIVLGYDSQHFAPLITIKDSGPEIRAVPLAYPGRGIFEELPVHFLMEKEQQQKVKLIKEYLTVIEIPVNGLRYDTTHIINAARLDEGNLPEDMNLMEDYMQLINHEFRLWQKEKEPASEPWPQDPTRFSVSQLSLMEIRCITPRCPFYVSVDTQPLCHECFERCRDRGGPEAEPPGEHLRPRAEGRGTPGLIPMPSPRSAPPTAPSLVMYSETNAMKCKTPGCLFTLNVAHSGLCERCFRAQQAGLQKEMVAGAGSRPPREAERCALCRQEAFRIFNGLCPPCIQSTINSGGEQQQQSSCADTFSWMQSKPNCPGAMVAQRHTPSGKPCKRAGCPYFGTTEKSGFCTVCFVDYETNRRKEPVVAVQRGSPPLGRSCSEAGIQGSSCRLGDSHSSPLVMRATQPRQMQKGTQCSRDNCNNISTNWAGLCPECHSQSHAQSQREGRRKLASEDIPKHRCRTPGCDHYANKEKQGYCNECNLFKQIYTGLN